MALGSCVRLKKGSDEFVINSKLKTNSVFFAEAEVETCGITLSPLSCLAQKAAGFDIAGESNNACVRQTAMPAPRHKSGFAEQNRDLQLSAQMSNAH